MFFKDESIKNDVDCVYYELDNTEYNFNTIHYFTSNFDDENKNDKYLNKNNICGNNNFSLQNKKRNNNRSYDEKKNLIKFLLNKKNKKCLPLNICNQKEKKKQRNREAADKSRKKKKQELLYLIKENDSLRQEIDEYNKTINLLCNHCKCKFNQNHDMYCLNTQKNNIDIVPHSTSSSMLLNSFSSLTKTSFSFFFGCLLTIFFILCIVSNKTGDQTQNKAIILHSQTQPRKLIESNSQLNYTSIKKMPQILIDDPHSNMSYYVPFEDFYKLKNKNMDMCKNPLKENIIKHKSLIIEKKKKTYYDSIYFKLFVPLCNEKDRHLDYFLNDIINVNDNTQNKSSKEDEFNIKTVKENQKHFYYEVKCQVMNFTKMIKQIK